MLSRLAVLATALLALAAVLLSGQPAQAQTTVWSTTLTVDTSSAYAGCSTSQSQIDNCASRLTDDDFQYEGTTYTIKDLYYDQGTTNTGVNHLRFTLDTDKTALGSLTLHAGSHSLALANTNTALSTAQTFFLRTSNPNWAENAQIAVSLTGPGTTTATTSPAKPAGFTATPGGGQVTLSWTDPSDSTITKWQYRQKTTGNYGNWINISGSGATTTSHTVTSLNNGTTYTFQVRAVNANGNSDPSDAKSATPRAGGSVSFSSPPSGWFKAGDTVTLTYHQVQVGQGVVSGTASIVRYSLNECGEGTASNYAITSGISLQSLRPQTKPVDLTLKPGVKTANDNFCAEIVGLDSDGDNTQWVTRFPLTNFRVVSASTPTITGRPAITSDPGGDSTYAISDAIAVTLTFDSAITVTGTPQLEITVGSARKAAACAALSSDKLVCTYTVVEGDAAPNGIEIEANKLTLPSGATIKNSDSTIDAVLDHSALGPQSGHKVGEGSVIVTTRPAKPAGFSATAGNGQVTLRWTNPSDSTITNWQYRQKTTGNYGNWQDFTSSATTTSHTVTSLMNGTEYTFQVRAVDTGGPGAVSDAKTATPTNGGGNGNGGGTPGGGPPSIGLSLSGTGVELYETGKETVTVALATAPQADVTVAVTSTDPTKVTAVPAQLVFTPDNWDERQTVTLTALADMDDVDRESVPVRLTPRGAASRVVTVTHRELPPIEVLLSLALNRVQEGRNLALTVHLSAAPRRPVTVPVVATPGTATPDDYAVTPLRVTFGPNETSQTVLVSALADDLADEPDETVQFAVGTDLPAQVTAGTQAATEVTIEDRTQRAAVMHAWLSRFGRTAATHVTDAVGDRLRGAPGEDSHLMINGYRVPLGQKAAGTPAPEGTPTNALAARLTDVVGGLLGLRPTLSGGPAPDPWRNSPNADPRRQTQALPAFRLREVLQGSAFRLNLSGAATDAAMPRLTAWGRFAGTTFDGQDGTLSLDGDVFTGTVGVDGAWDRVLAGVAVAHSRGDGAFTDATPTLADRGTGDLEQTLTSLHPYLRYAVTDRLDVWGLVGYGWGELDLELANGVTVETDTTLVMGAFGGRGILLAAPASGGVQLATRTDAMLTRTSSDAVANSAATDADAHRLRVILEGSRAVTWADGRSLTPTLELGVRHDWGDAETGFGLELGGRVQYADPALGLTIEGAVRGLLAHEDEHYQEWGASGTVRLAPGPTGRGLALTLAPTWGATASGVDGLWARQTTQGLAPQGTQATPAGQLAADVGYGFAAFDTGLLTPYAGTVLSAGADRTYRVGARWASVTGLALTLEGRRQEPAGRQPVNQGLRLQATWGF